MALKIYCFYCSFTLKWKIFHVEKLKWNIFPLFQFYETMRHGVEKKFQMPVLIILGLGQGKV